MFFFSVQSFCAPPVSLFFYLCAAGSVYVPGVLSRYTRAPRVCSLFSTFSSLAASARGGWLRNGWCPSGGGPPGGCPRPGADDPCGIWRARRRVRLAHPLQTLCACLPGPELTPFCARLFLLFFPARGPYGSIPGPPLPPSDPGDACNPRGRNNSKQSQTRKAANQWRWRACHAAAAPRPADQNAPRDWQRAACPPSSPPPLNRHASRFDGGGLPLCCRHAPPPSPPPPTATPSATLSAAAVCATPFPPDSRCRCHGRRRWRRPLAVLL